MKRVLEGDEVLLLEILSARCTGKFYSPRTTRVKIQDDDALARKNRSRSTAADRERFKALSRRVSSESVCRDPARISPGEGDRRIGDVQLIEMDTLLAAGAC